MGVGSAVLNGSAPSTTAAMSYTCCFVTRSSPQYFCRFAGACVVKLLYTYASACVFRNKMTYTMTLDYSEEEVRSLVITQLCPEARHGSKRLELCLAVDDIFNIFSALSSSACSTTCCCTCIAFGTVESDYFFRSVYRNRLCISGRHTGFILE